MARSFSIEPTFEIVSTRNYPNLDCPFFLVPLAIRDNITGVYIEHPHSFLWDTGAHLSIVDRKFAADYNLRLHDIDDRIPGGLGGVGGNQPAWLTTMKIQFPLLSKRWRETDVSFTFHVIVLDRLDMPILGTRDVLLNFSVESTWIGTGFTLSRDHLGEAE